VLRTRLFFFCKDFRFDWGTMKSPALLVIAKQPVAGRAKTRLTPPFTPAEAAALADAALRDTLEVVRDTPAARRVLVFDGADPAPWRPDGFEVVNQRGEGLGERLQAAFDDVGQPALLVGMDTPQLTPEHLLSAVEALGDRRTDAVLGPTHDGGYWCVGFREPVADAFLGVPMSEPETYSRQRQRFGELGLRVREQATLRDFDTIDDALAVAEEAPDTRFARTLAAIR
jgi:rSAM/selenodomain-associated transferase 1